jgi:hypothetical protein
MELEIIMLSKISQTRKEKYSMFSLIRETQSLKKTWPIIIIIIIIIIILGLGSTNEREHAILDFLSLGHLIQHNDLQS